MENNVEAVILAAGASRRMGEWKMTLPFAGRTIIENSVYQALEVCSRVILVAGYRCRELRKLFAADKRIDLVINSDYKRGMFSSVKLGTGAVSSEWFFLGLGDMPLVKADIYRLLLKFKGTDAVIPRYMGKKGHPLLLSPRVKEAILNYEKVNTLRDVLADFPNLLIPVAAENILIDIDNPEDYKTLLHNNRAEADS